MIKRAAKQTHLSDNNLFPNDKKMPMKWAQHTKHTAADKMSASLADWLIDKLNYYIYD